MKRMLLQIACFAGVHATACLAPFAYSHAGLGVCVALIAVTSLGITVGFHRLLCHRSFEATRGLELGLAAAGSLSIQGPAINWVAIHRKHHARADREGDPHSPHGRALGLLWAHVGWVMFEPATAEREARRRLVRDLDADVALSWIDRQYVALNAALLLALAAAGYAIDGQRGALSLVVWGFAVRVVFVWHATAAVNSLCHRYGYRRYDVADESRNNPLVALVSFGEGWHNNHHHAPRAARLGRGPFELDPGYWFIRLAALLGLARLPEHTRERD